MTMQPPGAEFGSRRFLSVSPRLRVERPVVHGGGRQLRGAEEGVEAVSLGGEGKVGEGKRFRGVHSGLWLHVELVVREAVKAELPLRDGAGAGCGRL